MHPIPGKLKDYIGAPKENGYRSIHTVVYPLPGVTEQPIEIQIRTEEMDKECEYGTLNHSDYKHFLYTLRTQPTRVQLFRNLETLRHEARSPKQFAVALRTYFDDDHLAIFDAKNNLYHMKEPVTALDFVCHAFGKRCAFLRSVRINGRELSMDSLLHDGDTVEPVFGRKRNLQKNWASLCRSSFSEELIGELSKRP
jgi:GTP pyrophosphokinase